MKTISIGTTPQGSAAFRSAGHCEGLAGQDAGTFSPLLAELFLGNWKRTGIISHYFKGPCLGFLFLLEALSKQSGSWLQRLSQCTFTVVAKQTPLVLKTPKSPPSPS